MSNDMLSVKEIEGVTTDLLKKLGGSKGRYWLGVYSKVSRGENPFEKHIVDLDAAPYIPGGWKIEEHVKGGQFEWNPEKIKFHLDEDQLNGKQIEGDELRKKLVDLKSFNANLLDFLITHQYLIPEEWKKDAAGNDRSVYFWGTVYRGSAGGLYVRCLCWYEGQWTRNYFYLGSLWGSRHPAIVPAS